MMSKKRISLVDSHAHLDLPDFKPDLASVLKRSRDAGVVKMGNVFLGYQAYEQNSDELRKYSFIFFVLGVHPHDADQTTPEELQSIFHAIGNDVCIKAWGEIGLDYFRLHSSKDRQQVCFRDQLKMAKDRDVPVVIHCRDAEQDVLQILDDMGYKDRPLLWHCFTQGKDLAGEVLARGWQISIPGVVSFANAKKLQEALPLIPLSRMVLESDCPFLAPVPFRGKRNEPAYVLETARAVAALKSEPLDEVCRVTTENAFTFFCL